MNLNCEAVARWGELRAMLTGVTTETLTTDEVARSPLASLATALRAYALAARLLTLRLKGAVRVLPNEVDPLKNWTLVTELLLLEAVALRVPVQGAAKVEPLAGLVMLTLGG